MRIQYLGDGSDLWKRVILDLLRQKRVISNFRIVAMAVERLDEKHAAEYGKILRVKSGAVWGNSFSNKTRRGYFAKVANCGDFQDFFLDPDTGIARMHSKRTNRHVSVEEIVLLAQKGGLIIAYDESFRRGKAHDKVAQMRRKIEDFARKGLHACAYDLGRNGAAFFVSDKQDRIKKVAAALKVDLPSKRMFPNDAAS